MQPFCASAQATFASWRANIILFLFRASDLVSKITSKYKKRKKEKEETPIVDPSQTKKFKAELNEEFK